MEARHIITEEYRRQQQELHKNPDYGVDRLPRLSRHFEVTHLENSTGGFRVVVTPHEGLEEPSPAPA